MPQLPHLQNGWLSRMTSEGLSSSDSWDPEMGYTRVQTETPARAQAWPPRCPETARATLALKGTWTPSQKAVSRKHPRASGTRGRKHEQTKDEKLSALRYSGARRSFVSSLTPSLPHSVLPFWRVRQVGDNSSDSGALCPALHCHESDQISRSVMSNSL